MTARTWQDNADEFGALTKQGVDVRLAALVACSVDATSKGGRVATGAAKPVRASGTQFAKQAGTTKDRVLRHLVAWDACAELGYCKPSADLTPGDVNTVDCPTQEQFDTVWKDKEVGEAAGSRPRDSKPEHAVQIIEKRGAEQVVAEMTPEVRATVAEAIAKADKVDSDLATIARGGKVTTAEDFNQGAGELPIDGIRARAIKFKEMTDHLDKALAILHSDLGALNESEKVTVQGKLLAFMDDGVEATR